MKHTDLKPGDIVKARGYVGGLRPVEVVKVTARGRPISRPMGIFSLSEEDVPPIYHKYSDSDLWQHISLPVRMSG